MPPFRPQLSTEDLLEGIATVLREADPRWPERVSQARFDARRSVVPGVPRASAAAERLRLPWPQVREVALVPASRHNHALGLKWRRERKETPGTDEIIAAIQMVARRRGVRYLRPREYSEEWEALSARERRAWRHGAGESQLPSFNQILTVMPWAKATELAGLDAGPPTVGSAPGENPIVMTEAFIEAFGCVPRGRQIEAWARTSEVGLAAFKGPYKLSLVLAEIEKRRAADGLPMPASCPRDLVVDPNDGAPRAPGTAVRKKKRWTDDEIVEGLVRALDELPPRAMLTQERLASLAVGRPDIPNWAAVHRSGKSWKTLKRLAAAERANRQKPQS